MTIKTCNKNDCDNQCITLSDFCGDHTNNGDFFIALVDALNKKSTFDNCNISAVEINPDEKFAISDITLSDCHFDDCSINKLSFKHVKFINCDFKDLELASCTIDDCEFNSCIFDQVYFFESNINNNSFSENEWSNCSIGDKGVFKNNSFYLDKFSNLMLHTILNAHNTKFEQCILTHCSINESNLDGIIFVFTEFSKTSIAYCSFRDSSFLDINHDFEQIGAPILCDFYGSKIDPEILQLTKDHYCNFDFKNYVTFIENCIKKLITLDHPNYLDELSYLLTLYEEKGHSTNAFKNDTISLFKRLYASSIQLDNIEMLGNIINKFTKLPLSIRQQSFLLPSPVEKLPKNKARLILTFDGQGSTNFATIATINKILSTLEEQLFNESEEKMETISLISGSIIQEIMANTNQVVLYAGALYAATNGVLNIIKKGVDIRKSLAETKKINIENEKNEKNEKIESNETNEKLKTINEKTFKKKIETYQKILLEEKLINENIKLDCNDFLESIDGLENIKKLDIKYTVKEIRIIIDD